jgi:hypothetical protein
VGLQRFPNPNGRMMESAGGCAFADETLATQSLKTSTGTLPELRRLIERTHLDVACDGRQVLDIDGRSIRRAPLSGQFLTLEFYCRKDVVAAKIDMLPASWKDLLQFA